VVLASVAVTTVASAARADVVTAWNTAALNAIRANRTPPPVASRALAILHLSIFDAVNGVVRSHEKYLVKSAVPASASLEAAASAAAHTALTSLFPSSSADFDQLHAQVLAQLRDGPHKRLGLEWGELVAHEVLLARAADNSAAALAPPTGSGPGDWQPTPPAFAPYLLPQWGFVTPFALPSTSFMRPPGPPELSSERWVTDYNEVKSLGAAVNSSRTPEQSLIALFWADGAGTETPPGHWNTIAQRVSTDRGTSLVDNARLFALLNMAMADAAICAWDAKYNYDFWRPVTAIRNGDLDGNAATIADPSWSSFIATPPFPDYISGHSTFSGAAATVLAMFYGTDRLHFTTGSDAVPGATRSFDSFSGAATEAALSRLFGGIHYRSANDDGLAAGVAIGEWAISHDLREKGNRSRN
jgi:membrane-associated phospholipid phosphatase